MLKKIAALVTCLCVSLCVLVSCNNLFLQKADTFKTEAESIIEWYKSYNNLAGKDLSELEITSDNLTVLSIASYFKFTFDYQKYYEKLETYFKAQYKNEAEVKNAYAPFLCRIIIFLKTTGKDPKNFCGYNLLNLAVFNSEMKNPDIYSMPLMLEATAKDIAPSNAQFTQSDIIKLITDMQDDTGGWGYNDYFTGAYTSDCDLTAMVLYPLSLYSEAKESCDKAVIALNTFKNEDNTFKSAYSSSSSSSTAVSLKALCSLKSGMFTKDEAKNSDVLSVISKFKNKDGGYRANTDLAESDNFSSLDVLSLLKQAHYTYLSY